MKNAKSYKQQLGWLNRIVHNKTIKGAFRCSPRCLAQRWVPRRRALALATLVCLSNQASSRPSIAPVPVDSLAPDACRVYHIDPNSEKRILVLFWLGSKAEMHIEGRHTVLSVSEVACHWSCVALGQRGVAGSTFKPMASVPVSGR